MKLKYEIVKEELENIKNNTNKLVICSYEDMNIVDDNQFIDSLQETLMKTTHYENEINKRDEIISNLQQQLDNKQNSEDSYQDNNGIDYTVIKHDLDKENEKLKYEINERDREISRLYQTINEKDNMLEIYESINNPIQINTNTNISVFLYFILFIYRRI